MLVATVVNSEKS